MLKLMHDSRSFFMTLNLPFASPRWWICLHLPDSPLGSSERSHSGGSGNPTSPGLFLQPQETLCGSDERHGTNRRGSAQDRSQPQHAEQQGQVGQRGAVVYELDWIVEVVLQLYLLLFLGLRCMKLWHQGMSQCSTSYCSANSKLYSAFKWNNLVCFLHGNSLTQHVTCFNLFLRSLCSLKIFWKQSL